MLSRAIRESIRFAMRNRVCLQPSVYIGAASSSPCKARAIGFVPFLDHGMSSGEVPWLPCSIQIPLPQSRLAVSVRHASLHLGASLVAGLMRHDEGGSEPFVPFDLNCIANVPDSFHNSDTDRQRPRRPPPYSESWCDPESAPGLADKCIDRWMHHKQSAKRDTADPSRLVTVPEDLPERDNLCLPLWPTGSLPNIQRRPRSVRQLVLGSARLAPAWVSVGSCHSHPSPHRQPRLTCSAHPRRPARYTRTVCELHTSSLERRDLGDSGDLVFFRSTPKA